MRSIHHDGPPACRKSNFGLEDRTDFYKFHTNEPTTRSNHELKWEIPDKVPETTVLRELERTTAEECAEYARARMQTALQFERKKDLWDHALSKRPIRDLAAEFGVWNGQSINYLAAKLAPSLIYGFDSFEGLREDWSGWKETKGTFSLEGRPPVVASNVRLVKGWFDETVPKFLVENTEPFSFVHIDCDTYESSSTVLDLIGPRLEIGTILVFDEYFGYRGWRLGEFKAWKEFIQRREITYEYMAFSLQAVSLRITRT